MVARRFSQQLFCCTSMALSRISVMTVARLIEPSCAASVSQSDVVDFDDPRGAVITVTASGVVIHQATAPAAQGRNPSRNRSAAGMKCAPKWLIGSRVQTTIVPAVDSPST